MITGKKRIGTHVRHALTALQVARASLPGRYADGGGLYLEVDPTGNKRWLLRVVRRASDASGRVVKGKRHDIGLGTVADVSLADARAKAAALRVIATEGADVLASHRASRIAAATAVSAPDVMTFTRAAEQVHATFKAGWSNGKHREQWLQTIQIYASPMIGDMPIVDIEQKHALRCLSPIWLEKPETARRLRQRLKVVFDWAKAHGHRSGDNPISGIEFGLPAQNDKVEHHKALGIDALPGFIVSLHSHDADAITKLSLEWLILSATRANETRFAAWSEIDHKGRTWTIPADRMKARTAHTVPLTPRMLEILEAAADITGDDGLVFAGTKSRALSENTMTQLAKSVAGDDGLTVHGFRSCFRDWAAERTSFPGALAEASLAHALGKVEAAYQRSELIEKRRELMAAWSNFAAPVDPAGNVVAFDHRQPA